MDNFDLKKYLKEGKLNEANNDIDLFEFVGKMIIQNGLLTREKYDEIERRGDTHPESILMANKEAIIKISEEYQDYLDKVGKVIGELKNDPLYKVAVADAGRNHNPLELAYWRATKKKD